MTAPKFVERVVRLPEVFAVLQAYPDGLPLQVLADQFGVTAEVMGEDLVTFVDVESWGWDQNLSIFRPPVLEFGAADDPDDPDADAFDDSADEFSPSTIVRVVHDTPSASMGVEHLSPGDLATIYTAGLALLDAQPDDEELSAAMVAIAETMYGETASEPSPAEWNRFLPLLQQGQAERRRVDITYSRAWSVGVSERTIEPLRLVQTHRGWEVDAGPLGDEGNVRTFLLSNVRLVELTDETFVPPPGIEAKLFAQRTTTTVRMALAQDARWATDMYAEDTVVLSEDETEFEADLEMLPPLGERVALLLLAGGPRARLLEPTSLMGSANEAILRLLDHHDGASTT